MKNILKYSLKQTTPIMLGYIFMGMAWGLMLQNAGFNAFWAFVIALTVYTGSGQFLLVGMLSPATSLISIFVMQLSVNSRHMFYGLSFLERFKKMGKAYPYMIFSLTDETYSLLCYTDIPDTLDEKKTTLSIAMLDQSYWLIGCTLGATLGEFRLFDITGVDFAMTALFAVIFVEQWMTYKNHIPVFAGIGSGIICLLIFNADNFILPALFVTVGVLMIFRKPIERDLNKEEDKSAAEIGNSEIENSEIENSEIENSEIENSEIEKTEMIEKSVPIDKIDTVEKTVSIEKEVKDEEIIKIENSDIMM